MADQDKEYLTTEDLEKFRTGMTDEIKTVINEVVTGLAGRLKKDLNKDTNALFAEQQEQIKQTLAQFSPPKTDQPEDTPDDQPSTLEDQLKGLLAWKEQQTQVVGNLQTELGNTKNKLSETERNLSEAEKKAQRERIRANWLKRAGDKVYSPDQLLDLAISQNLVTVEGGELSMQSGEIGLDGQYKKIPSEEIIGELIKKPEFAHFKKTNSGSGTGSVMGNGLPSGSPQLPQVDGIDINKSAEEINAIYAKRVRNPFR